MLKLTFFSGTFTARTYPDSQSCENDYAESTMDVGCQSGGWSRRMDAAYSTTSRQWFNFASAPIATMQKHLHTADNNSSSYGYNHDDQQQNGGGDDGNNNNYSNDGNDNYGSNNDNYNDQQSSSQGYGDDYWGNYPIGGSYSVSCSTEEVFVVPSETTTMAYEK